jgi:alkylation response protein AidB-like acyl-CoA dehydrogenase
MACRVVDRAMQAYGAEGLSQDQELASMFAQLRTLRLADVRLLFLHRSVLAIDAFLQGPDEVCLHG